METRTEWRVVADARWPNGNPLQYAFTEADREDAERALEFHRTFHPDGNVRIQTRTVIETDWHDYTEPEE